MEEGGLFPCEIRRYLNGSEQNVSKGLCHLICPNTKVHQHPAILPNACAAWSELKLPVNSRIPVLHIKGNISTFSFQIALRLPLCYGPNLVMLAHSRKNPSVRWCEVPPKSCFGSLKQRGCSPAVVQQQLEAKEREQASQQKLTVSQCLVTHLEVPGGSQELQCSVTERYFCPWQPQCQLGALLLSTSWANIKSIDCFHEKSSGKAISCHYAEEEEDAVPREALLEAEICPWDYQLDRTGMGGRGFPTALHLLILARAWLGSLKAKIWF